MPRHTVISETAAMLGLQAGELAERLGTTVAGIERLYRDEAGGVALTGEIETALAAMGTQAVTLAVSPETARRIHAAEARAREVVRRLVAIYSVSSHPLGAGAHLAAYERDLHLELAAAFERPPANGGSA